MVVLSQFTKPHAIGLRAIRSGDPQEEGAPTMNASGLFTSALAFAAALMIGPRSGQAAEIHALITTAMKAAVDELTPAFERTGGDSVRVSYGPSGGLARRFVAGEPADVIIIDSGALEDLIRQGKVLPGRTDVARTGIGIAVRKDAPRPDVSSPEALKRARLLQNRSATRRRPEVASRPRTSRNCSSGSASRLR